MIIQSDKTNENVGKFIMESKGRENIKVKRVYFSYHLKSNFCNNKKKLQCPKIKYKLQFPKQIKNRIIELTLRIVNKSWPGASTKLTC